MVRLLSSSTISPIGRPIEFSDTIPRTKQFLKFFLSYWIVCFDFHLGAFYVLEGLGREKNTWLGRQGDGENQKSWGRRKNMFKK